MHSLYKFGSHPQHIVRRNKKHQEDRLLPMRYASRPSMSSEPHTMACWPVSSSHSSCSIFVISSHSSNN